MGGNARDDSLLASVALLLPRLPRFANLAGVGLVLKLAKTQLNRQFDVLKSNNGMILELILFLPFPARKRRTP